VKKAILFDLGGVLIEWDPRRLFRPLISDEAELERFLAEVCTPAWNLAIDAGKPMEEAVRELQLLHPEASGFISLYHSAWANMLGDAIHGTVSVLRELKSEGLKVCALSNWSAQTFPIAQARFAFLTWFDQIIISGDVGLAKPDPAIFTLALARCGLVPEETIFIDDVPANVAVARELGLDALLFQSPERLRKDLNARSLLL
jgi:2-haloacid dehalogenase